MKILMIATSHEQLGNTGRKTGLWLEELAVPYLNFKEAGAVITLASPTGGPIPLDPKSESVLASSSAIRRFQRDQECSEALDYSIPLDQLKAETFDMVYIAGGHGALWDFAGNEQLLFLLKDFIFQHKVIGLVSHAAAALVTLQDITGDPFVKGRRVTCYSDAEETVAGLTDVIPFSLESKLVASGAIYSKGPDYRPYMITDGNIVYGQNAASAMEVGRQMLFLQKDSVKKTLAQKN
jgi:putative intracellular protease/amidase